MGVWRDFDDLRQTLGGVAREESGGDNLAILLASYFEPSIESDELDESETWKQGALDKGNAVLDAIHGHYVAALHSERDRAQTAESTSAEILKTNAELVASLGKMGEEIAELVEALREARSEIDYWLNLTPHRIPDRFRFGTVAHLDSILARYGKGSG